MKIIFAPVMLISMRRLLSILFILILCGACSKETDSKPVPGPEKPIDLLTSGTWLLTAFGFDDDSSGIIEANENQAHPCQLDNTIRYNANGTGHSFENLLMCTADPVSAFQWEFTDNQQAIRVYEVRMELHILTREKLHFIINEPVLNAPLHAVYKKMP